MNGEERCGTDLRELMHTWAELVAYAARGTELRPGDILIARAPGRAAGPPLRRGDVVELECDGIGVLGTRVA